MDLHLDFGGLENLDGWAQFDILLVCVMTIGQSIFVLMWLFLPWWREWVTRALMVKSVTLATLLLVTIINTMLILRGITYPWIDQVQAAGYVLMTLGVWSQAFGLGYEIRQGNIMEMLHAKETKRTARIRKFKPLLWIGTICTVLGTYWVVTTDWDVLALILTGVGIGTVIFRFSVSRAVKLGKDETIPPVDDTL